MNLTFPGFFLTAILSGIRLNLVCDSIFIQIGYVLSCVSWFLVEDLLYPKVMRMRVNVDYQDRYSLFCTLLCIDFII